MLALCLMLSGTYYAQNYASIIGWCMPINKLYVRKCTDQTTFPKYNINNIATCKFDAKFPFTFIIITRKFDFFQCACWSYYMSFPHFIIVVIITHVPHNDLWLFPLELKVHVATFFNLQLFHAYDSSRI